VIVLSPPKPHASVALDAQCDAHGERDLVPGFPLERALRGQCPRVWRVAPDAELRTRTADRGGRRWTGLDRIKEVILGAGTTLRLDAISGSFYCDGQTHSTQDYRFCVLDGPFASTCIESMDTLWDDHVSHTADPIETLVGVSIAVFRDAVEAG
jgi:hypothetical protein